MAKTKEGDNQMIEQKRNEIELKSLKEK